jgi:hypothetical protein
MGFAREISEAVQQAKQRHSTHLKHWLSRSSRVEWNSTRPFGKKAVTQTVSVAYNIRNAAQNKREKCLRELNGPRKVKRLFL